VRAVPAEEAAARQAILRAMGTDNLEPDYVILRLLTQMWTVVHWDREKRRLRRRLAALRADGLVAMRRRHQADTLWGLTDAGRAAANAGRPA
jgi:hypothetical protein